MYIEQRTYTLQPGKTREYLDIYEKHGFAQHSAAVGRMIGVFTSEIGDLNQMIFMVGYDDLKERCDRRAEILAKPEWQAYASMVRPMIVRQQTKIMVPAPFSPLR